MRITKRRSKFRFEEEFFDREVDIYSDDWDDEEGIDSLGMKASEVGFLQGFKRF